MTLAQTIQQDAITAQKNRDAQKLDILRVLRASIQNATIQKRSDLTDEEVVALLRTEVKRLREAEADFQAGGRTDLVLKTALEINTLQHYLPAMMGQDAVREIVRQMLASLGSEPKQAGRITGEIMKNHKGKIDGGLLARVVKEELGT